MEARPPTLSLEGTQDLEHTRLVRRCPRSSSGRLKIVVWPASQVGIEAVLASYPDLRPPQGAMRAKVPFWSIVPPQTAVSFSKVVLRVRRPHNALCRANVLRVRNESEFPEFCPLGDHLPARGCPGAAVPEPWTENADPGDHVQSAFDRRRCRSCARSDDRWTRYQWALQRQSGFRHLCPERSVPGAESLQEERPDHRQAAIRRQFMARHPPR